MTYPGPVLAAAVLAAEGVSFLLVGSAALWLHGEPVTPADADAVIEPDEQNLRRLDATLTGLTSRSRAIPRAPDFPQLHLVTAVTSYGRIDCLLERGRLDWDRLALPSTVIPVADVGVRVAALADTWALKHRYKR